MNALATPRTADAPAALRWINDYARLASPHEICNHSDHPGRYADPKFVLRNHVTEVAIRQAQADDFDQVQRLLRVLERPYDEQPEHATYADFPPPWAQTIEVSCSS